MARRVPSNENATPPFFQNAANNKTFLFFFFCLCNLTACRAPDPTGVRLPPPPDHLKSCVRAGEKSFCESRPATGGRRRPFARPSATVLRARPLVSSRGRSCAGCWRLWRPSPRRRRTGCCACPWRTSCGSKSLSWGTCSSPRIGLGWTPPPLRTLGLLKLSPMI